MHWQQTPFIDKVDKKSENQNVSCETMYQLSLYMSGSLKNFSIPIDFTGWSFEMVRWFEIIALIPYGKTLSYQDLASNWGNKKAARAAGQACRRNPIPIIIPCHRVINKNGTFNQYSGGDPDHPSSNRNLARKEQLIQLESQNV